MNDNSWVKGVLSKLAIAHAAAEGVELERRHDPAQREAMDRAIQRLRRLEIEMHPLISADLQAEFTDSINALIAALQAPDDYLPLLPEQQLVADRLRESHGLR